MNHGETRKTITLENQPMPHRACFNTAAVCKHEVTRNKSHLCIYRLLCKQLEKHARASHHIIERVMTVLRSGTHPNLKRRSLRPLGAASESPKE